MHEVLDLIGYALIVCCGMGRLYASAFLSGMKNKELVTYGPFSVVRNPLYVFSWLGFTGFAIFSNNIAVMIIIPVGFFLLYLFLVKREEAFLLNMFGEKFVNYCTQVPRFIPKFSQFSQPQEIILAPRLFLSALLDNVWWFVIPPILEMVEL